MWTLARCLALATSILLPASVAAQASAEHVLEDAATFRRALDSAWGNARLTTDSGAENVRFTLVDDGIEFLAPEETAWTADDVELAYPLRMLAALLSEQSLTGAVADLGFRLNPAVVTWEVLDGGGFTVRLGGDHASAAVESGTARPREIRIVSGNIEWTATAEEYGERGRGWMPTHVVVAADGDVVVDWQVTDLARTEADLAPLPGEGPIGAGEVRFPRLPL